MDSTRLIVVLAILLNTLIPGQALPTGCKQKPNQLRQYTLKCEGLSLTSFPTGLSTFSFIYVSGDSTTKNNIPVLDPGDFQGLTKLFSLEIAWSQTQTIQVGTFAGLGELHNLNLANNNIRRLTADTFKGLPKLRSLDLSGNKDCEFDSTMFTNIAILEELNLGDMNLRKIDNSLFSGLRHLKVLKLQMNNIKKIHQNVILNIPSLQTLDINGNKLRGIPVELKSKFQSMTQIHISENPLQCNCQLIWLRELAERFYYSKNDASAIICNGPAKLKYSSFVNVPESEFVCIPPKVVRCQQTTYSLPEHQPLTIECEYEGDPEPEIKWRRPDGQLKDGRETNDGQYEITENGTLIVHSVNTIDDGSWTVTAYNKTASDDLAVPVHVILPTTPTLTKPTTTTIKTTPSPTTPSTTTPTTTTPTTTTIPSTQKRTTTRGITVNKSTTAPLSRTQPKTQNHQLPTTATAATTNQPGTEIEKETSPVSMSPVGDDKPNENGINWILMAAAAVGGGTLVGIVCLTIMCCKKKQDMHEKNKIEPFELDIY
ncbi:leucine-rich repeat and fibronectin type III domain-containing protein 1-like protein [Mya arenaria]|uniref:leucine-rich repeat and fibronectin type III domain-containing protein 1-like protein n=1 Tax=Mya arenaria TaxID=6604 RepID=UPI0022E61A8E|nr:leucine-rich repeat and fibronectin type III domain-containing protein 1-like protein [Mya arenaria]